MLSEGRECREVVIQISAATKALEQAGFKLVAAGLTYCVEQPDEAEADGYALEDVERMFLNWPDVHAVEITVATSIAEAEDAIRESLAAQGFGVLTEIDVSATLKAKLGVDRPPLRSSARATLPRQPALDIIRRSHCCCRARRTRRAHGETRGGVPVDPLAHAGPTFRGIG